jgi:hypothetical protein
VWYVREAIPCSHKLLTEPLLDTRCSCYSPMEVVCCTIDVVPRPYFQFVGPGSQNFDSVGVVMEVHDIPPGESS